LEIPKVKYLTFAETKILMEKSVNTQSVNTKNINIQNVNIKEKLKMYFDLSNDIETLDEQRKIN